MTERYITARADANRWQLVIMSGKLVIEREFWATHGTKLYEDRPLAAGSHQSMLAAKRLMESR